MVAPGEIEGARHAGVAAAEVGVDLRRVLEQPAGVEIGFFAVAQAQVLTAQDQAVGAQLRRVLGEEAPLLRGADLDREAGRDHRGDVVLEREQVTEVAVVAVRPDHPVGLRLGELHPEPELAPGTLETAGHEVTHPKLAGDLCKTGDRDP